MSTPPLIVAASTLVIVVAAVVVVIGLVIAALMWGLRRRGMDQWLGTYMRESWRRRTPSSGMPVHLLICIGDHYEPMHGKVPASQASARVESWVRDYPKRFGQFRDSDGRPPRHSFFFPIDEYDAAHVDALAELCRDGFGEIEIHLHHDHDTADGLRRKLLEFKELFHVRHGVLPVDRRSGEVKYGFIHGNWALDNSRPDGRWCGVNNELDILRETGCYADFTMPSAPSDTQTRKINSIYYAIDDPQRPKSHDWGIDVGIGPAPASGLMLIQGPLLFNWRNRKWGVIPRIENGCLQLGQSPTADRLDLWIKARVQVPSRPDWFFVKLHTHGAIEPNQRVLLGDPMMKFHETLARRAAENTHFRYHYVSAREMYNLVRAAEAGWTGNVAEARDFELVWQPSERPADIAAAHPQVRLSQPS